MIDNILFVMVEITCGVGVMAIPLGAAVLCIQKGYRLLATLCFMLVAWLAVIVGLAIYSGVSR